MSEVMAQPKVPKLRFPEFADTGRESIIQRHKFDDIFAFSTGKNIKQAEASPEFETPCVRYGELYHIYGEVIREVVNKTNVPREDLHFSSGDEILIPSAGEDPMDIGAASALMSPGVAIGRTINILRPQTQGVYSVGFAAYYINSVLRRKISTLARGSSISNVYNSDLKTLHLNAPSLPEQEKIAKLFGTVDQRIRFLESKRESLAIFKKGVLQRLFSRELRFMRDDGSPFPDWQEKRLSEVLDERGERSTGAERVHSVSVHKGVIDQIEHLGRSFAAASTDHYGLVKAGDVVYTKSPTGDFPFGIVKQNRLAENVIVSPLYGIFTPETYALGYILNDHFLSVQNIHNYLHQLVQKGAKNTINITNAGFLEGRLTLPIDPQEQKKIAEFLYKLDTKIDAVASQVNAMRCFKKGLLQQMFV